MGAWVRLEEATQGGSRRGDRGAGVPAPGVHGAALPEQMGRAFVGSLDGTAMVKQATVRYGALLQNCGREERRRGGRCTIPQGRRPQRGRMQRCYWGARGQGERPGSGRVVQRQVRWQHEWGRYWRSRQAPRQAKTTGG